MKNDIFHSIRTPSSETSSIASHDIYSMSSYANSSAIESASMGYQKYREGGRAKWGSYLFDSFSKDSGRNSRNTNGPTWLEKRLNESRDSEEETMSISVQSVSSFLRGQNIPLDPMDLAERENKRRKAMELQNAIKEQLLERENIKKLEKEKQWQQEKLEEERLSKQMELERQRLELDRLLQNEKLQNERMRQEAMRLALEKAAFEAQFDRERKKRDRALANSLDEKISIQKVGEKTEIIIEGLQKSTSEKHETIDYNESATETMSQIAVQQQQYEDEEDDGETMLIGTPIKLKKKNLDNYRKKLFTKRQQQADNSKSTSDEDVSSSKCNTLITDSCNEKSIMNQMPQKTLSDLDGIALVLQTMPMVPFIPLSNDVLALNQFNFNNLALLMASHQNRLNAQNTLFPFIASPDEKLDFSKLSAPQANPTPTPNFSAHQFQQTAQKSTYTENDERPIRSAPMSPDQQLFHSEKDCNLESAVNQLNISVTNKITSINESARKDYELDTLDKLQAPVEHQIKTPLQDSVFHVGTQDAFTSTINENGIIQESPKQEIKILTPKKYRDVKQPLNSITIGTQTESPFLYCEYCFFQQHQHHHQQHICNTNYSEEIELTSSLSNQEANKPKDKNKIEDRPRWGSRVPPIKYVKASDKDPFYASMKNRKKRYIKKSDKDTYEECVCNHKDCPLVSIKSSVPLLNKRFIKANNKNFSSDMLPIKTDKNGRVYLLHEDNFIINEALRKHNHHQQVLKTVESDNESILDMRNNIRNSLKLSDRIYSSNEGRDFQDIFVET